MNGFEEELQESLGRLEAPDGFADRVMARVERRKGQRRGPRAQRWRMAIAAALIVVCAGVGAQRVYERHEGEVAAQQFDLAMRVTARSLEHVDRGLDRLGGKNDASKGEER